MATSTIKGQSIAYVDVDIGDITIGGGGYTAISSFVPSGITPIATMIENFYTSNGAIGVTANGYYAFGAPGTTMTIIKL